METAAVTTAAEPAAAVVWLRGNHRLAALLGAAAIGLLVVAAGTSLLSRAAEEGWSPVPAILAAGLSAGGIAAAAGSWLATRPRLLQRGDILLARVGPVRVDRLPLAAVEAVFLGSQPLDGRGREVSADVAAFRVGTLVVRIAERAVGCAGWTGGGPWAFWEDGYLVIDGRWTEPLTAETVRRVNGRLIQAKRTAADAFTAGDCCR